MSASPDGTRSRVDRADPLILLDHELVLPAEGMRTPLIRLDGMRVIFGQCGPVYVLGRYLEDLGCWEAQWPD